MNKLKQTSMICFVATIMFLWACENNKPDDFGRTPYDPSKPVRIDSFEPDSGGMATKVFINGSNFGSDVSKIKVYFNDLRASVVGSDGNHLYVITPRRPGREVTISVVVNGDSTVCTDKKYLYRTLTTVTTIAGKKGTTDFKGGTLAEAEFSDVYYLCVDAEDNIFLSHWGTSRGFVLINQEKDIVQQVYAGEALGVPATDAEGKRIMAPTDARDGYYYFDPDEQWAPKSRLILHPTTDMINEGMKDFNLTNKAGLAFCHHDGYMYTNATNGHLVKFHPVTRVGQLVDVLLSVAGRMCFDPYQPNILYLSYRTNNTIYRYDINTGEYILYAGVEGIAGWKDGHRLEAEFYSPYQMVVDQDGSLVVADRLNHCIRRISRDGMVTTVIGKGGISGYQDGNLEDALFNNPMGLAIDKNGTIYVADLGNQVIRKLAVE